MKGILVLNKEVEMTSHDLVNIVRKKFNIRKVGHAGTLDPNATGVMVLLINQATKLSNYLITADKEYIFEMKFNVLTDTLDIWGNIIEETDKEIPTKEQFEAVLKQFKGKILQRPPMYSAIKIDGKKMYELARQNIEVDIPKREVEIYDIKLLDYQDSIKVKVSCSSGTYIRSLILDIGKKFNTYATMTSLVRSKVDKFTLDDAYTLDQLENDQYKLLPLEAGLSEYPIIEYQELADVKNGRKIVIKSDQELVLVSVNHEVLAIYEKVKNQTYKMKRGLW